MHSPLVEFVGIDNASEIFKAARHPKSFVSLDDADRLLSQPPDASFAAGVISGWLSKYISEDGPQGEEVVEHVRVTETGGGKFQNAMQAGRHRIFADEPESVVGLDTGPSPYDFFSMALGACTSMTLRLYAEHKKLDLPRISVDVSHAKIHADDCEDCATGTGASDRWIDRFERTISIDGNLPEEPQDKFTEIADKCPVHRTLKAGVRIVTEVKPPSDASSFKAGVGQEEPRPSPGGDAS